MSLPRVFAGRRRALVARLVASGAAQAGAALLGARALHEALREPAPSMGALAALAASGVALATLRVLAAGTAERLGQDYVTRVRLRIFEAVAARPSRAPSPRAGVAMTRVITDLGSLRRWVSDGIARSVVAGVTIAAVLGVLAVAHPRAALAFAGIVFGCAVFAGALAPGLRASVREARRRRGRLANNLGEKLLASRTIRQLGRTQEEAARVRTHSGWLRSELVRRARWAEALVALPALATPLALAAWLALRGGAESSELAAGVLMLGLMGASLRDLARALEQRVAFGEGRRRIRELLATPRLAEARRARPLAGVGAASIEFAGVSVDGALRGVGLVAKAGERVLVTGPSGAGKSTLLALAVRALDPDEGEILLAGQPLRALALDSVHDAVQLVSPELPLLRGSVSDNLSYGAGDDDPDWIEAVALACGLVSGAPLPDGLGTRVEERGANLSAGLRARVALARAIAMRPRLLLVDDPVFAVDRGAREALIRALELHPATALVVAPEGELAQGLGQVWRLAPSDSPASSPSLEASGPGEGGAPADAHSDA